ncbi:hypothetical protein [Aeromicrobium sp. UC242_57]|uniref:hypothetical protein n=1 Tax=Aeromicrobium sp. UC242_57 TaxID=3374624 RepID=UPI003797814E
MPFELVLALLLLAGLALIGLALSGYGSRDRSHEPPPRMPGHEIQEEPARRRNLDEG